MIRIKSKMKLKRRKEKEKKNEESIWTLREKIRSKGTRWESRHARPRVSRSVNRRVPERKASFPLTRAAASSFRRSRDLGKAPRERRSQRHDNMHLAGWYYLTHAARLHLPLHAYTRRRRKSRGRGWMTSYIDKNHRGRVSSLNGRGRRFLYPSFHLFALHRYIPALFREFACEDAYRCHSLARLSLARCTCCRRGCDLLVNRFGNRSVVAYRSIVGRSWSVAWRQWVWYDEDTSIEE